MTRRKAHRAETPRRFGMILLSTAALLLLTTTVLTTTVAVSTTGGTYAYLRSGRAIPLVSTGETTATIKTGSAVLALSADAISLTNLYPGDVRRTPITVTNTGSVPLALSVAAITGPTTANGLAATVASGACPGTGTAVSSGSLGVSAAAGAATTLCLSVSMVTTAPSNAQSLSTTIAVQLVGTQS